MRDPPQDFGHGHGHGLGAGPAGPVASSAEAPPWDTELFLIRAADRGGLLDRIGSMQRFLKETGAPDLKDLAYSLNTAPGDIGEACLALVAGSAEELQARLATAADRLADPNRTQIRDGAGIYYVDRPLQAEGSLAFLFPGEGGEYLNMLADLCPHFPEIEAIFANAERLAFETSQDAGERFVRLFRWRGPATEEHRAVAQTELARLDAVATGVLTADWAMFKLLSGLGLKAEAMAGHSLGEVAALQACGTLEDNDEQLAHVGTVLNQLLSWEEDGAIPPALLLAVGTGRPAIEEVVRETTGGGVFLAMDNCPHQTIAVGPRELIEAVEAELKARRFICERLPFDVPYHTPMFEPYLGPLRQMFGKMPFRAPRDVILYSCSTGRPFPADPDEIRQHAVQNFARPVEFTTLIRAMHQDGVRLFVECGPRGNLTSFVEDILRRESFAAIASNLPSRSGVTQLNHLAGQLAAHHVPLRLEHFYARRSPRRVDWIDDRAKPAPLTALVPHEDEAAAFDDLAFEDGADALPVGFPIPSAAEWPSRSHVVAQHLDLMDQFLDCQVEVMAAYLGRARGNVSAGALQLAPLDRTSLLDGEMTGPDGSPIGPDETVSWLGEPAPSQPDALPQLAALPLLASATVLSFAAGQEMVVRRPLDLAEDLFARHHTVGGHAISKVDPLQHGLAVMPMTFSLEIMAELAVCLVPGFQAISVEKVRLMQWLAFDEATPSSVEASARLLPDAPADTNAAFQVAVEIYVIGGAPNGASRRTPAAQGVVLMAEAYPEPPPPGDYPLTNEHPSPIPVDVLYRNLFHGPLFQGTLSCGRRGDEGLESEIVVMPRERLLRSQPDPDFLMDPVTLDIGMHPISAWHLEFADQSGRILLPVELKKIDLFGSQLAPGARLTSRASVDQESYRHFAHSVDLIGPDGTLWSRMRGLMLWRFYVPFAEVNFFGPKDEYCISKDWDVGLAASPVSACCIRLDIPPDQTQKAMRTVTSKVTLAPPEMAQYVELGGGEAREAPWLFGRLVAKDAVRILWRSRAGERLFPADIVIQDDGAGGLLASPRGAASEPFPNVAIADGGDVIVGVAAFGAKVGIALDRLAAGAADGEFAAQERLLLDQMADEDRPEWVVRFRCAKDAVGKALSAERVQPGGLVVEAADPLTGTVTLAGGPGGAGPDPVIAYTARQGDLVVAVSMCEKASP